MSDTTTGTTSPLSMEDAKTLKFIAELQDRIASLEADNARLTDRLNKTCKCSYEEGGRCYVCQEYCGGLEAENARLNQELLEAIDGHTAELVAQNDDLRAENARLASEQQHCAKCGGVECHALAGLFCGEHSYEGCREWGGCPICENAKLKSALAASGRGK